MRLIMKNDEFYLYELDSESELKEYIRVNKGFIVGNDSQVKNKFYVVELLTEDVNKVIGILNEGQGILPTIGKLKDLDVVIVASDKIVYFFDLIKNQVIKRILSDSLILNVMIRENEKKMFIICELGIQCLTITGDKIWTYDSEIISDFSFYNNYVKLTIDDTNYKISLFNGEVL